MDYNFRGDHYGPRNLTRKEHRKMSNAGFSAPVNFWGTINGLTPKSSGDGKTSSVAEAPNEYGDTAAHDVYGEVLAPSTEYAVTGAVDLSQIVLGSIHSYTIGDGGSAETKKLMLTTVAITTQAGNPPTVTISGVEVESDATEKRTYALTGTLTPRSKAQDVCGAFESSANFTQINTNAAVDPHVQTVGGVPVASDASHGRIEVQATMTDPTGNGEITAASAGGFTVTASPAETDPDANYITRAATATKYLIGTEAA